MGGAAISAPGMGRAGQQGAAEGAGFGRLRAWNALVGLVHLAQAAVLFALSNDFRLPVTTSFLSGPPGSGVPGSALSFEIRLGPLVALFLFLAAVDHLLVSAPGVYPWYVRNLRRGVNYARWYEYSVSASVMIVAIALVCGIADLGALILVFAVNAAMILCGLMMERWNQTTERTDWTTYVVGCLAGMVPWIVFVVSLVSSEINGGDVPTFVYAIVASLFLLFNSFAVNMWLQFRRVGPWRDYLFGERAYIVLSLVAKTALAWQVFANTLID